MINERIAKLETNIENIKEDIKDIKSMLKDHVSWEGGKYEEMEKKYANKWVEKVVYGIIISLLGAVIAMIKLGI